MSMPVPYDYQEPKIRRAVQKMARIPLIYLAFHTRTGKTLCSLWIAERYFKYQRYLIDRKIQADGDPGMYYNLPEIPRVLFITKKTVIPVIQIEYDSILPFYEIVITNFESAHKVEGPFHFGVVDEGHSIGKFPKPGVRAKVIKQLMFHLPLIIMTATPCAESYGQLFHQFWISKYSPWINYRDYYKWAQAGYINVRDKRVPAGIVKDWSHGVREKIMHDVEPFILTLTQKEAGFEQVVTEEIIYVELSDTTKVMINDIKKDRIVEHVDYGESTCSNAADVLNKLRQLCSGTLIFDDIEAQGDEETGEEIVPYQKGQAHIFDESKAKMIKKRFAGQRIVIMYYYVKELEVLKKYFPDHTKDYQVFERLETDVFIGQVKSVKEGIKLSTADALVMYTIDFSSVAYWQSRNRIQDKHRTKPTPLYWIFAKGGIEDHVLEAVKNKDNFTTSIYRKSGYARERYTVGDQQQATQTRLFGDQDGSCKFLRGS